MTILVIFRDSRRVFFTRLREDAFQNDCNTNLLVHFDLKSLSISKKKRNLNWKSIERVRERKIGRGGSSIE